MASTYLKRTNGSPTNAQKGTFSAWVKRAKVGAYHRIIMNYLDGNNYSYFRIHSDNYIQHYGYLSGSAVSHFKTNRLFRDINGWYHLMLVVDTTQSTASDRVKIYVNGVQETSFSQADYPNQNITYPIALTYALGLKPTSEKAAAEKGVAPKYMRDYLAVAGVLFVPTMLWPNAMYKYSNPFAFSPLPVVLGLKPLLKWSKL